jgi:hypothetical protein
MSSVRKFLFSSGSGEVTFFVVWFYYLFIYLCRLGAVALISLSAFVFRLLTLMSRRVRCQSLGLDSKNSNLPMKEIMKKLTTTDWVLLHLLRQNMDQITFEKLIYSVDEQL